MVDNWSRQTTPMKKDSFGVWEVTVPANNGQPVIPHKSKVKVYCIVILSTIASSYWFICLDLHDHSFRRTYRTPPSLDQVCDTRTVGITRLRRCILESSKVGTTYLQAPSSSETSKCSCL